MKTSNIPQPPLFCQFADDNEFPAAGSSLPMGSISTNVGRRRYRKWRRQIRRPPGEEKWCQSGIRHGGAEGCLKNCPRAPARRLPLISNDINLSSCVLPTHFFSFSEWGRGQRKWVGCGPGGREDVDLRAKEAGSWSKAAAGRAV